MNRANWDVFYLIYGLLTLIGVIGWVLNLIKLVGADAMTGMVVARAIGVFVPPVGAVLGFIS